MTWIVVNGDRVVSYHRSHPEAERAATRSGGSVGWLWLEAPKLPLATANRPLDRTMSATSSVTGLTPARLRGGTGFDCTRARAAFMLVAREDGYIHADIAAYLDLERSTVTQVIRRSLKSPVILDIAKAVRAELEKP